MSKKISKPSLTDLAADVLSIILGKVAESSPIDFGVCMISCKRLCEISKFPDVLKHLNLATIFPPPWDEIPEEFELLYDCAKYGNVHAIFLCGLIDFYFLKQICEGIKQLSFAAETTHSSAMYLYGMILIGQGKLDEGSDYITQLWKQKGILTVRQSQQNCRYVVLELTVRQYREYEMVLSGIEVGDDCATAELEEVCDNCFIYKEIYRFLDYMHFV